MAVNNGKSLPFYDASNNFVGTSFQYSTDVVGPNVVPEFGQISVLVPDRFHWSDNIVFNKVKAKYDVS